jgi:hypothetical protein
MTLQLCSDFLRDRFSQNAPAPEVELEAFRFRFTAVERFRRRRGRVPVRASRGGKTERFRLRWCVQESING